jgi:DNA repair exonuclease SbcCD ATPase subunit
MATLVDLNKRLARATERAALQAKLDRRLQELQAERARVLTRLQQLEQQLKKEEKDVRRLEGFSLLGLLYTLLGTKEERLTTERQEAVAACLKHQTAMDELQELEKEIRWTSVELEPLQGAAEEYQAVLADKEKLIRGAGGEAAGQLFALTEKEEQLRDRYRQLEEALAAGDEAVAALSRTKTALGRAQSAGTWDLFLGGLPGMIATASKHGSLDEAQRQAGHAQHALAALRRELKDVDPQPHVGDVSLDGFSRFADYFFDGLIMDWVVQSRIDRSLSSVRSTYDQVAALISSLRRQQEQVRGALAAAEQERVSYVERCVLSGTSGGVAAPAS